jgi:tRNA pseudouridine55 synthase
MSEDFQIFLPPPTDSQLLIAKYCKILYQPPYKKQQPQRLYICCVNDNTIFEQGQVILIDKPFEWTSFDVVRKIRYLTKTKKVGHAGTLDPLATGLLIVCTGKFTKKINEYMAREKEYTGAITLGATTPTYDLESEPENSQPLEYLTEEQIRGTTKFFTGNIFQIPPIHSAIKKDGQRSYDLARRGVDVKLEPRPVTISGFEITKIELPAIYFKVVCTTGTYIRSLANDFGEKLGCGGYLSGLCRTRIGEFLLKDAKSMEQFEEFAKELRKDN